MGFLDRFSRDSTSTPDALTLEVVARIRALDTVDRAEAVDGDTISVTWAGRPSPEEIDIGETRGPWKQAKGFDRIELLDEFIARLSPTESSTGLPDLDLPGGPPPSSDAGWSEVQTTLLPVLRRRRPSDDGTIAWPVGDLLEATAAGADGAEPVTAAQCARWGVDAGEVRAAAVANIDAIDPAPDAIGMRAWVPTSPDGMQSSWLAAPGRLLERVGLDTGIVLVPLRSELVVVDPTDTDAVQTILTSTLTIVETQSGALCPVPFLATGDDVQSWLPPADHPASELVRQTRDLLGP